MKCTCQIKLMDQDYTPPLVVKQCSLCENADKILEALKRVRHAFYVDGTSKALRKAFEGTKELVAKTEGR